MRRTPPHLLVALLLFVAAAGASLPPAISPVAAQTNCDIDGSALALDSEEVAAVEAINALRAVEGSGPLTVSLTLTRGAAWKSARMAAGGPFDHDDEFRTYLERVADCGYTISGYVKEDISGGAATAGEALALWQQSNIHRDNLLDPMMTAIGIARAQGPAGWFWTVATGPALDEPLT